MPKSSSNASHTEHKKLGENNREKKTPTLPHRHDRKKKCRNVQGKEAAVGRKSSSRGENDSGGARRSVCYTTQTVSYVSGGVQKQVQLKVPLLRLNRLEWLSAEFGAMTRSKMSKKSDSKEKGRNSTPADAKSKVSAVSDSKHIPARVTRSNSPPQCMAALAGSKPGNKSDLTQKNKLRSLIKEEVYDDISDVPLEEYCDAKSIKAETEAGATNNEPRESRHTKQKSRGDAKLAQALVKKHKSEPLETAAAEGKGGQPPHKKQKSTPLDDLEDISDTPLDEYGFSENESQCASVANATELKVAKARDTTTGLKPSDCASNDETSKDKAPMNKAAKKGPPEAHSSVKISATKHQLSKAKLNLASTKPASKPSPAPESAKDVLEKRAVKRSGTPCKDLGAKKSKTDADAAKEKVESNVSTTQRSNSSPLLTKKAPLAKSASKLSPRTKNTAATCGLKETPATKVKASTSETTEKAKSASPGVQQKSCPEAVNKVEKDKREKKPVHCSKSSSDKPASALGNSKNIPASSSTKTAGEVTNAKPSSEVTIESTTSPVTEKVMNTTSPVTEKVLPGKLEKTQAHSTKDRSSITASKSGDSDVPAKDLPTAKTVKSVTGAKANQVAKKKTMPTSVPKGSTDGPAALKGTTGVATSSGQSITVKAPLSTENPLKECSKSGCSDVPAKDLPTAKTVKSVTDAKAKREAKKKTLPTFIPKRSMDGLAAPEETPGVATSSGQSVTVKAPLSTENPLKKCSKSGCSDVPAKDLPTAKNVKSVTDAKANREAKKKTLPTSVSKRSMDGLAAPEETSGVATSSGQSVTVKAPLSTESPLKECSKSGCSGVPAKDLSTVKTVKSVTDAKANREAKKKTLPISVPKRSMDGLAAPEETPGVATSSGRSVTVKAPLSTENPLKECSKSGCSDVPAKDSPTAKTVKSVTDANANQEAKKKTLPTSVPKRGMDGPAAPEETPGVTTSSGQSVPVKALLSTQKPFNDKAKVEPANEPGKIKTATESGLAKPGNDSAKAKPISDSAKVKPGTCVSSAVAKTALSTKLARTPASCAKSTLKTAVTAAAKALISSAPEKQSFETSPRTNKRPQPDLKTEHLKPAKNSVLIAKKTAVENINANGSTERKLDVVPPNKETAKGEPSVLFAAGIEVKISRSKLPSNQEVPKCSSGSQIHAAAAEILSHASKRKGNEQRGTCDALASENAKQIREEKAQLTQCAEPSVSVPDSDEITSTSSTFEGLCEKEKQEHHTSNNVEMAAAEVTGERSSLQSTTTGKGAPAVTVMSTETPAPTTECVSGESLSDIVGAISERAPCTTGKLHKDKSDLRKPCKSTVQVTAKALEQHNTSVPYALDVEADVSGGAKGVDAGAEEECLASVADGLTIHREDREKQQDASDTASKSRDNISFVADATSRNVLTVASTCHPSDLLHGNASQMWTVHGDGDPQEKNDSDLSSINTSAPLQKGLLQTECSNESSTRGHTEPPTNAEVSPRAVSVVSLPKQSRSENAQGDSSGSLPKEAIDALVVTGHSEVSDRLLEGSTSSSSAGDMVADTSHSNSQMPSTVNLSHPQKLYLDEASSKDPASDCSNPNKQGTNTCTLQASHDGYQQKASSKDPASDCSNPNKQGTNTCTLQASHDDYQQKASSKDPASDCSNPNKQGTNTCTLQASHDDYQQIDQEKVALIQKPLRNIKVTIEKCSSERPNVGEGYVSKSEETTIGALLKELVDVASSNAKDDLCRSTATGGSFQGPEEPMSSPVPAQQDKAVKCLESGPTGELHDSAPSIDICQPTHEVLQWQAEHARALTKEKEGIPIAGSEPIQKLHSEGANKGDFQTGCETLDQVPAEELNRASPTKAHSSLPLFQPSADATLSDSFSGNRHREEALKNEPAEGEHGNVAAAALPLRPDTSNENSVGLGSDIMANKSTSRQEEATIIEQQPVLEARGASSDKTTNSGLGNRGSTKKRLCAVAAGDVKAASDEVTLHHIDREPALDAKRGVEDSRRHVAAPCTKSCGSSLHSALLDLDMISCLHILDVCGSHAEKLVNLKKRIESDSITKREAVTEISQLVHTAVVEELFKRDRADRALNLLARIPFSLDPHEVVKIRKITQSI